MLKRLLQRLRAPSEPDTPRPPHVEGAAATDAGAVRSSNQDSVYLQLAADEPPASAQVVLAIVADGMGGHAGGNVASRLAVERVAAVVHGADPQAALEDVLRLAVAEANRCIFERAAREPELHGMGTTLTALLLRGGLAAAAQVGDSRLYRRSADGFEQISRDQTVIAELLRAGAIDAAGARDHPDRHVVTQAVGTQADVEPDVWSLSAAPVPGEAFLLCSDGLHDIVADDELDSAIAADEPADACRRLVALALERGAEDNVSVLVLKVVGARRAAAGPADTTRPIPGETRPIRFDPDT